VLGAAAPVGFSQVLLADARAMRRAGGRAAGFVLAFRAGVEVEVLGIEDDVG
jgi:hypothetical protein